MDFIEWRDENGDWLANRNIAVGDAKFIFEAGGKKIPLDADVIQPIIINKEKNCFIKDGKEYPATQHNLDIYKKYLDIGELSTVALDI